MTEKLRIVPLGGLGEVGKNMMSIEYGRNILVVDAGIMFPESDMLGIDYIIPDWGYLRDKKDRVRAIVITHGHEDHIGALSHFLEEFDVPVYATRLTQGLIEVKMKRRRMSGSAVLHTYAPGDVINIGPFTVEPYHVCHSIPDGVGLGITTPAGLIVHSGDFKFDHTPVDGWPTDYAKLAEFSGRGVLVLLSDSTNSDRPGNTPSEAALNDAFHQVMREAPGRVIVATFASLISRIQQVVDVAAQHGRKIAIAGRTMVENTKMARELGYLNIPDGMLVTLGEIKNLPARETVIMATGTQGEPRTDPPRRQPPLPEGRGCLLRPPLAGARLGPRQPRGAEIADQHAPSALLRPYPRRTTPPQAARQDRATVGHPGREHRYSRKWLRVDLWRAAGNRRAGVWRLRLRGRGAGG
jgi:ribonuclease J